MSKYDVEYFNACFYTNIAWAEKRDVNYIQKLYLD